MRRPATSYFVTGCSSGIGKSLVEELVQRGCMVWGVARRRQPLMEMAKRLTGGEFHYTVADTTKNKDVHRTMAEMKAAHFFPGPCHCWKLALP